MQRVNVILNYLFHLDSHFVQYNNERDFEKYKMQNKDIAADAFHTNRVMKNGSGFHKYFCKICYTCTYPRQRIRNIFCNFKTSFQNIGL